jgi:hypothetical protein
MGRRPPPIAAPAFSRPAALNAPRMATRDAPAHHLGIRRIHESFRAHADRLAHGADDRRGPAEHTLAERELRPTVSARQVSFGAPSAAGAHSRGVLMSVLYTVQKRPMEGVAHLQAVLDVLALDLP